MIAVSAFLRAVQSIADKGPSYRLGGSGTDGTCDCIGLIIGAVRQAGGKWAGTHGSNWAARNALISMSRNPVLELGTLLFKAREPGQIAYGLPAAYHGHSDQRDYYHVGVVTSVSPLRITHCTGGSTNGIKVDTKLGAWLYGGRLEGFDYGEVISMEPMDMAKVFAANGGPVRMRVRPDAGSTAIANVPSGTEVRVLEQGNEWWKVSTGGKTGWMMRKFLDGEEAAQEPPRPEPIDRAALLEELARLNAREAVIVRALTEVG